MGPLKLHVALEKWTLTKPFRITGYTTESLDVVLVVLEKDGQRGQGEAAGVYYRNDDPEVIVGQIESVRKTIENGLTSEQLQRLFPPGGARNALDCAWWDLNAKLMRKPAWQIAGVSQPRPLLTTFTCGADDPDSMAGVARSFSDARAIKIKLTGEPIDADRVRAIRAARPDVWLGVDANQGFTRDGLDRLMPSLLEAKVQLIEQPFPVGQESLLDGLELPIPVAADESAQESGDIADLVGRFDVVNIKLDKCGGLTEGLTMARLARDRGLGVMVGNMIGTSLAMAPACVLGQLCDIVDLDGPIVLRGDREIRVQYSNGYITAPATLWGA
jgi:L-alanine-DL-glutamate epimerase-like enolase superfamily enzyme